MDFTYLTNELNKSNMTDIADNYATDILRLGALLLMSVCLKGFIGHLVNIVLLVLLLIYVIEYVERLNKSQHSIHKVGALNAFESQTKNEHCNHQCEICNQRNRNGRPGPQINYGYTNDEEPPRSRSPIRNGNTRPEYMNPVFDRSNSWQPSPGSSRPFSYLEDVKRPPPPMSIPPSSPSASANDSQWRHDRWQTGMPPVPAPDYSPHGQRKLKSALKSYM
ncbi:unnamed protein product [Diatraea saccharalis]|uniref:Uncharacterized protein n=1 Tax=Diatraea saccharalis TaxID=40085 RepID=A0A9N9N0A4_9NEOP|nr:unnamed protein product [Diatraea saccharalis]